MNDTEKLTMGGLVSVLALVVPGFLLHVAPRFPGSLIGGMFGIAAAALFVLLLAYSVVKRSAWMKAHVTRHASLRAILAFHVYAGVVGALLGIVHSGHTFRSPVGIALVASMLAVVFSGFAGHYVLLQLGTDVQDQQARLAVLRPRYDAVAAALAGIPVAAPAFAAPAFAAPGVADMPLPRLIGAIAELEHSIADREALKRMLSRWVVVHIGAALIMYSQLALHVWNGIYYGLRWLG